MEGHSITSPPLIGQGQGDRRCLRRRIRHARFHSGVRCGQRQAAVEVLHDSRPGRVRQRHVEGRQLEDRRRPDVADRPLRSRAEHVYWPVGNPGPQIDRSVRGELDNLFSDSVVALDADTGMRKWHYQFTPNDGHDWDSAQDMILVDRVWHGQTAQAAAPRRSQRDVLRARSHQRHSSCRARRSSIRTGTRASTQTAGRWRCLDRTRARKAASSSIRRSAAARISRRRPTARRPAGSTSSTPESGQQLHQRARAVRTGPAVHRPGAGRGAAPARGPDEPPPNAGHQGDRSGNRQDDLGFQDLSGLAHQRPDGDRRRRGVRVDRATATSWRSTRRPASSSGTSRPAATGRVADELRRRRPAVRGAGGR